MADSSTDMELEILRVTYDAAVRKHAGLIAAFESFRGRASNMLGVAIGVAAFLGGFALDKGPEGCQWFLLAAAFVAFLGAGVLLVMVQVTPISAYEGPSIAGLLDRRSDGTHIGSILGSVSTNYADDYQKGQAKCDELARRLVFGSILVGVEVLLLLCLIAAVATNPTATPTP
jgi:hypothetical protein